jgi:hypothetical protein
MVPCAKEMEEKRFYEGKWVGFAVLSFGRDVVL